MMDGQMEPDYTISSPGAFGSGELKIYELNNVILFDINHLKKISIYAVITFLLQNNQKI